MAYNNFYGAYPQYGMQSQASPSNSGLIWVQGEAGAKSYLVAPNTTVALWDSEDKVIYLKSADNLGMPSIRVLDYTMRGDTPVAGNFAPNSEFVTKDYISTIEKKITALEGKIEQINTKKTARKETNDAE